MANINDVAERAKVSITTVSHVINQTRYVSDDLTERVRKAMEELDYHPNSLARGLRSGKTKTIGLVIPDISNQFFAEISRKIEDKGYENGYSVILCNTDDDPYKEKSYIDVLLAKKVEGIIFISAGVESNHLEKTIKFNIPIVVVDRDIKENDYDIVLVDNSVGGFDATKYLIELGHQRIACIAGPSPITPSAQRVAGYKQALQEAGIPIDTNLIIPGDFHYESGDKAMRALLALPQPPTAVFACNDMMALGAFRAVNNQGMKIPEDISVIGFDNIPFSQTVYPTLTTMAQPIHEMADLVVDLLVDKIKLHRQRARTNERELNYKRIVLETKLIKRNSCRAI
ncbi:MAG: LacI family transcriptional regulator [Chloroflexi bacterium]|jgi:LacI family transcriptional regulator|nr:LacI family transcriptional regulator [Chloroflexota bacterium]